MSPLQSEGVKPSLRDPTAMTHDLSSRIEYSEKYVDDTHEYRHVILPKEMQRSLPDRLLTETEWRQLGVQQSRGWVHYAIHKPEPHILLFRRPLGTDPTTGRVNPDMEKQAKEKYAQEFN
ncbi:Cyclin-dependent kinases regulatory subunit 1 [Phytophthora citrophthora]|uniref:Cyclin-dependent kinases regulatory subunit n=2 Tax=Phytophthora TaxID=4783 RepID=A0AAD9GSC9_9STRA|nr:Cyclin-dependent kinases regulatory subunit 1 [Phytophthora citrophthora]